jgi:NRPS condensation-like uncharacterized protein
MLQLKEVSETRKRKERFISSVFSLFSCHDTLSFFISHLIAARAVSVASPRKHSKEGRRAVVSASAISTRHMPASAAR